MFNLKEGRKEDDLEVKAEKVHRKEESWVNCKVLQSPPRVELAGLGSILEQL